MPYISEISPDGGTSRFDLKDKNAQTKNLTSPIEVGGEQQSTVEDCLSALAESGGGGTPGVFYNTDADAEADIANIPEGSMVYTNDGEDEPINARQIAFDDGTQTGSDVETQINNINNDLTDYSVNTPLRNVTYYNGKLYQITSAGQRGSEISMSRLLDYSHSVELNPTTRMAISYTTPSDGILIVSTRVIAGDDRSIYINNKPVFILADINLGYQGTIEGIPKGSVIKTIGQLYEDSTGQARHLTFVPYK